MASTIEVLRQKASQAWDEFSAEMAKYSDDNLPTEEQAEHITRLRDAATAAQKDANRAAEYEKMQLWESQENAIRESRRPPHDGGDQLRPRQSLGAQFASFEPYRAWLAAMADGSGYINPVGKQLQSPRFNFRGLADLGGLRADLLTGSDNTSAGALVIPDQYGPITEFGRRPLTIRQIITNLQTDSDSVEFVRVTDETSAAAPVPEATHTDADESGGEPGIKPESSMTMERVQVPVRTIAHWIPATTRALADASQIRGIIDSFLRYGLDFELEEQVVNGDGTGENFTGILQTDGVQEQVFLDTATEDQAFFRTARRARRLVRTIGRRVPTAFVLNPIDKEVIDTARDNEHRFFGNGPFSMGPDTLWGLPVVESEAIPAGTGLVGDFSTCVLWDRQAGSISVSNSHADFFIRNLVAVLAELRAAFGILKPNALVEFETETS